MKSLQTFEDVIISFEVRLTAYLAQAGYSYAVFTDLYPQAAFLQEKEYTVYSDFCCDLLKYCEFPILKKKDGVSVFNPQSLPALHYIEEHYEYDMDALWSNALRTLHKARLFEEIETFHNHYRIIYIYGCGKTAQQIEKFFLKKNWQIDGYLETIPHAKERNGKPIIAWKDFQMSEDTGIIVGMHRNNADEVRAFLPEADNILFIS